MIGRPDWFTKKNFGIGIRPKSWQGWVYILAAIALILFTRWQPCWDWSNLTGNIITAVLVAAVFFDAIHMMYLLNKENRGKE